MLLLKDGLGAGLVFGLVAAALPLNLLMVFISTGPRFFVHTSFVSRLFFVLAHPSSYFRLILVCTILSYHSPYSTTSCRIVVFSPHYLDVPV